MVRRPRKPRSRCVGVPEGEEADWEEPRARGAVLPEPRAPRGRALRRWVGGRAGRCSWVDRDRRMSEDYQKLAATGEARSSTRRDERRRLMG